MIAARDKRPKFLRFNSFRYLTHFLRRGPNFNDTRKEPRLKKVVWPVSNVPLRPLNSGSELKRDSSQREKWRRRWKSYRAFDLLSLGEATSVPTPSAERWLVSWRLVALLFIPWMGTEILRVGKDNGWNWQVIISLGWEARALWSPIEESDTKAV